MGDPDEEPNPDRPSRGDVPVPEPGPADEHDTGPWDEPGPEETEK